ncbi:DUF2812 domain-containing protein [Clostridium tertium]|uniref:DUF2812 domain-containing protein n=1 Tax=Clostridium tertium TaxID=1559 RepID=A0A6N3G4R1_9CLOT
MKSKYIMISGLAFDEEGDMEKLKNYARQGWILEGITGGVFYKLKKDKPQEVIYSVDYQIGADEEYFAMFKEAGWKLVTSVGDEIYIFMAQDGAKPIYSDCESEVNKYINMRNKTKRGSLYSSLVAVALICLLIVSIIAIKPIFLIVLGLLVIDICVFIFNFMPYLAYNYRIKQIQKYGKCKEEENKMTWKLYIFAGVLFCILGILYLLEKKYFAIFYIILGIFSISSSLKYYKKYKKSL